MNISAHNSLLSLSIFLCLLLPLRSAAAGGHRLSPHHRETAETPDPRDKKKNSSSNMPTYGPDNLPRQAHRDRLLSDNMPTVFGGDMWGDFHYYASQEGIDVSHYQGYIDWAKVASSGGISYVYVKATEGASHYDDMHTYNISCARQHGLKVGSYHYYRPNVDLYQQLDNLCTHVKAREHDLVPMIDIEEDRGVSEDKFISDLKTFLRQIERHYGKKPLLYTGEYFYNRHFKGLFGDYQWMVARYSNTPPTLHDGHRYLMWQYSDKGRVAGIPSLVDRSRIMGNVNLKTLRL